MVSQIRHRAGKEPTQREAILSRIHADNLQLREPGYHFTKSSPKQRRSKHIGAAVLFVLLAAAAASYQLMPVPNLPTQSHLPPYAPKAAAVTANDRGSSAAPKPLIDLVPVAPMTVTRAGATNLTASAHWSMPELEPLNDAAATNPPSVRQLFGLSIKTIVIDAGHGGTDPGAVGPLTGIREKDVTLDIAQRLKEKLSRTGAYRVLLVRDSDRFLALKERATYANAHETDLFISIHVNSIAGTSSNAIETYYFGRDQDIRARTLARRENEHSAYSIGEFERLVKTLQDSVKLEESMRLAGAIQASLLGRLRQQNKAVLDTGVKTAPFAVLMGVKAPSVLAEIGNLGNPEAEHSLGNAEYRDTIAAYIASGIADYLNHQPQEAEVHHVKVKDGTATR